MWYLLSCDDDLEQLLLEKNRKPFDGYIERVPEFFEKSYCTFVYDDDVFCTNLFVVHSYDANCLDILTSLCRSLKCHIRRHDERLKTISLYRFNGLKEHEYYTNILISLANTKVIEFKIINHIATYCMRCRQCKFGTPLVWIESSMDKNDARFGSEFLMNFQFVYEL